MPRCPALTAPCPGYRGLAVLVAVLAFALAGPSLAQQTSQQLQLRLPPPMPGSDAKAATGTATPPSLDCAACGRVESIQQTMARQQWTPLGTGVGVAGAPVSPGDAPAGVASFKIGPGLSNQGIVVVGAAGGASYSKTPGFYDRPRWDVTIKMDSGPTRVVSLTYEPYVREGDRVRISGNQLELIEE